MSVRPTVSLDPLEPRRLMATTPVAINFNDEALWDDNFAAAAQQAKALGVQSVRLWFGFDGYDTRPNAWDPVTPYGAVSAGEVKPEDAHPDSMPTVMTRAFQLKRMGFSVLGVLEADGGVASDSADQARGFVRHMMDATETPDSTQTLSDVIDAWEIGNEVDNGFYWTPSATNKVAGLKSYVDNWLIPASEELHSGPSDQWEKVVSAGVSYNPADLKTILDELGAQGALDAIDYAGFHPYGQWTASNKEILTRSVQAKQYADAAGKKLVATEWNVRGMGNTGANDAAWVKSLDEAYRQAILPNFDTAYYFCLVNNFAARGSATSARPGGVLKHDTALQVTPLSPIADLRAYFRSPVVVADPFYSTFKAWQYGTVSGKIVNQAPAGTGSTLPAMTVYVDANGNGQFDASEPSTTSDTAGLFSLKYSVRDLPPDTYSVRVDAPDGTTLVVGGVRVPLTNTATTGVTFAVVAPPGPAAAIGGYLWNDSNANGLFDTVDTFTGSRVVYLDANGNSKLDAGEKQTTSDAAGNYRFDGLTPGTYFVTRVFPSGYRLSNGTAGHLTVTVAAGQSLTGVNIGSTTLPVTPPVVPPTPPVVPPTPPVTPPGTGTASIAGKVFAQIAKWNSAAAAVPWSIYLDADKDGVRDAGEVYVATKSDGLFSFTGLAAGSYAVAIEAVAGWKIVTPSTKTFTFTLKAGQAKTGQNFVVAKV